MAGVRLSLIFVGLLLIQSTAAYAAEAPTVANATTFFGAKMGKEEEHNQQAEAVAEAPEIRRLGKHHFHTSMAGGGVLIGGLATAVFGVLFCYIRVTKKPNGVN